MKIVIEINTDNAAFEDSSDELLNILKFSAERVAANKHCSNEYNDFSLFDTNGNKVGEVTVTED